MVSCINIGLGLNEDVVYTAMLLLLMRLQDSENPVCGCDAETHIVVLFYIDSLTPQVN